MKPPNWGVMPEEASARLRELEWDNRVNLRARLSGERAFPIEFSLRPPNGPDVAMDVGRFEAYVRRWREFAGPGNARFETRGLRGWGSQKIPVALELHSVSELATFIGTEADHAEWHSRIEMLSAALPDTKPELVRQLGEIAALESSEVRDLAALLPQLRRGMGQGGYVRSLAIGGVGTKVVEGHAPLIERLLRCAYGPQVLDLFSWLNVRPTPTGNLLVRVLDSSLAKHFAGASTFWLPSSEFSSLHLPPAAILIVENAQAALSLSQIPGLIVLGATGRDLSWLPEGGFAGRKVAYWGDMDTWGYHLLDVARRSLGSVPSLMMQLGDAKDLAGFMSTEPAPFAGPTGDLLTASEVEALGHLRDHGGRLEQEKVPNAVVVAQIRKWVSA